MHCYEGAVRFLTQIRGHNLPPKIRAIHLKSMEYLSAWMDEAAIWITFS